MTVIDRAAGHRLRELDAPLVSSPVTMSLLVLGERPAAPTRAPACGERLPREVLVRLAALSRQVASIREGNAANPDLTLRLESLTAGLDALVQSIYDETVLHLAGRRG